MNTQLQIRSSLAQLGLRITPLEMNIKQELPKVEIESKPADMKIQRHEPVLQADWTQVWEDLGLKRPSTLAAERKTESEQQALEFIQRTAQNGDRVANLKAREENVFGNIARDEFFRRRGEVQVVLDALPNQGPKWQVDVRPPEIEITPNQPVVRVHDTRPQIDVRLGDVEVYLEKEPIVDIYV
ncbi:hypothetical protein XYCOK13_27930 [Xylanibacillus composti]|uniref:YviE n=1 Tax=Xylanibacillus composti TaxID=1572762 RepID=A0A8J4H6T0_9BACL|nr:DUF6470 family protein [Xylanibacillus composti]GIQ69969.1 hypothetical protein XYCOK13_27930 [Xylanibacillus composti]